MCEDSHDQQPTLLVLVFRDLCCPLLHIVVRGANRPPHSADIDAGLIGMHEVRLRELGLRPLPEGVQPRVGRFVEVEHRAGTEPIFLCLEKLFD